MRRASAVAKTTHETAEPDLENKAKKDYELLTYGVGVSSLGSILVATTRKGVAAVLIGEDPKAVTDSLQARFPKAHLIREDQMHQPEITQLMEYIETGKNEIKLNLDLRGTEFQKKVWQAVRKIKIGQTTTYTELARSIGSPKSIRAVANACSINPYAFAVPCHRVLHKERALSFASHRGNDRQRPMVDREAEAMKQ